MRSLDWRPAWESPDERYQDDRTDESDNDAADQAGLTLEAQETSDQPTDEGADDPEDDVPDNTVTATLHDLAGEPASNQSNDQPRKNSTWFKSHESSPCSEPCSNGSREFRGKEAAGSMTPLEWPSSSASDADEPEQDDDPNWHTQEPHQ
jgi:hypothetical protein